MTKVARLFEEEKIEAVNKARQEAHQEIKEQINMIARNFLLKGDDYLKVMECTGLTRDEVEQLQKTLVVE